jgi:hypothetical protein
MIMDADESGVEDLAEVDFGNSRPRVEVTCDHDGR